MSFAADGGGSGSGGTGVALAVVALSNCLSRSHDLWKAPGNRKMSKVLTEKPSPDKS